MRRARWVVGGLLVLAGWSGAAQCAHAEPAATNSMAQATLEVKKLKVNGMTCLGCVAGVKNALLNIAGVKQAEVSLENNEAIVEFDPTQTHPEALLAAVTDAGFQAELKSPGLDSNPSSPNGE